MTPDECRARAEECDRLARTCSYMKDRDRLMKDAAGWRDRAQRLEADARETLAPKPFWRRKR